MLVKTEALVLQKVPHSDHSAVVKLFTKEFGVIPFLIQGLHGKQNKNAYYQPGQFLVIIFHRKTGTALHRIKEVQALQLPKVNKSPADEFWSQQLLAFAVELSSNCLSEEHAEPELFSILLGNLKALSQGQLNAAWFPLRLCLDVSDCMGQGLPLLEAQQKGGLDLMNGQFAQSNSLPQHSLCERECTLLWEAYRTGIWEGSRSERLSILEKLILYLSLSFFPGKSLKSISVIREMSSVA